MIFPNCDESVSIKPNIFASTIKGIHTDFVLTHFIDKTFLVISQYSKLGAIVEVTREPIQAEDDEIYQIKSLLGANDENIELTARYLAKNLQITRPLLISLALKDPVPTKESLNLLVEAIKSQA